MISLFLFLFQALSLKANPYSSHHTSKLIDSNAISLEMKLQDEDVPLTNLSNPINIFIERVPDSTKMEESMVCINYS